MMREMKHKGSNLYSLELIYRICQPFSSVFLSQQISKQYFQPWPKVGMDEDEDSSAPATIAATRDGRAFQLNADLLNLIGWLLL
jgi:hypothetical protein